MKCDLRPPFLAGTTASCADNALLARRLCLGFLQQRLSKMTKLDQEMLDALRVYDSSLRREPQWGEDFFGIDPFYIALGKMLCSYPISSASRVFVHTLPTVHYTFKGIISTHSLHRAASIGVWWHCHTFLNIH